MLHSTSQSAVYIGVYEQLAQSVLQYTVSSKENQTEGLLLLM